MSSNPGIRLLMLAATSSGAKLIAPTLKLLKCRSLEASASISSMAARSASAMNIIGSLVPSASGEA